MQIVKEFTFDAAHQLPDHEGKCANLHGHTYRVQIGVSGPVNEMSAQPNTGMVVDFQIITDIWKKELEPRLDHCLLVGTVQLPWMVTLLPNLSHPKMPITPDDAMKLATIGFKRVSWLPVEVTTAELIAQWIFQSFYTLLRNSTNVYRGVSIDEVRLWETPTGFVVVRGL